jgi:LacI family transcriptional regulator
MAITLKDIAKDLGVSVVTVSKVLRNHEDIGAETRARVQQRIKELNYQPNLAARALVTGRSYLMGLVVPDLVHAFFSQFAKDVSRVLRKKGFGLIISSSDEDSDLERREIGQMLARSLDVLLIASTQLDTDSFEHLREERRPFVLIDRRFNGLQANYVGTNDLVVGEMATEHLIENGCHLIAHIGRKGISPALDRLEGYRRTLARHNISISDRYITTRARSDESGDISGYDAMKMLLKLSPRPDGVFCYNDPLALGAMRAILEAGLRIPQDIAIVGCGNVQYAPLLRVPLTSIDQNCASMGERAARLALGLVGQKAEGRTKTILIEPTLIVRESSLKGTRGASSSS